MSRPFIGPLQGLTQNKGFRDGGRSRLPDAGPDPTDLDAFRATLCTAATGEKGLMIAVLDDALVILGLYRQQRQPRARRPRTLRSLQLAAETRAWVHVTDSDWPFSFENLCEALGVHPGALRSLLTTQGLLDDNESSSACSRASARAAASRAFA